MLDFADERAVTYQGRTFAKWVEETCALLDREEPRIVVGWFVKALSNIGVTAVSVSEWHPDVILQVKADLIQHVHDRRFVAAAVRFALCSSKCWSDLSLARHVAWQAGNTALSEYTLSLKELFDDIGTPLSPDPATSEDSPQEDTTGHLGQPLGGGEVRGGARRTPLVHPLPGADDPPRTDMDARVPRKYSKFRSGKGTSR